MATPFDTLFGVLREACQPQPADLTAAVQDLPEAGHLPSPWDTWTLFCLVRHHQRHRWLGDIVTTRLRGDVSEIGHMGAFGHPPGPQRGPVPGLPEWEFYFHGIGCCLTHRVTGESIDVDFFADSADYFDLFFYEQFLKSLREPEPPEQRLLDLHPSVGPIRLAAEDLLGAGLLTPLAGREAHPCRVAEVALTHEQDILAFCTAWADPPRRTWLAAVIGDWPAAHDEALRGQNAALLAVVAARAAQSRELREQRLQRAFRDERSASLALLGLADVGADSLPTALGEALAAPPSGLTSTALKVISKRDDAAWCAEVYRLFLRVAPNGPIPQPHLWMAAQKFLLRHGHRKDEVLQALPRAEGYETGEACLLALEQAPALALPLIRRTLQSAAPANRCTVAAVLALIDRPWSRRELVAALVASDDQEQTAECRAALLECHDAEAHRAVQSWEECNPHEPETPTFVKIGEREYGPCLSMSEIMLRDRAVWVRYEMEKLHDRVMKVRERVPPEPPPAPPRPWWKFWGR